MKKILSSTESKDLAAEVVKVIASPIKQTLGPGGNPQIIERRGRNPDGTPVNPLITKDGVTVAEHIALRDPAQNAIAQSVLQVAKDTVLAAGDGTTTAMVLAEALYESGYKLVKQGNNGIQLYNELKAVRDRVVQELEGFRRDVTLDDIYDVALISSNGDEEVAKIVADAINCVGEDGHIALEEGTSRETHLIEIQGAVYKQGWRGFGPHGSNLVNEAARNTCEFKEPAILLYADKIDDVLELAEMMKKVWGYDEATQRHTSNTPFVIVAHDYSADVKNFIIQVRVQNKMNIVAIKSPFDGSPNARTEMMKDMSVLLGATVGARGILELKDMNPEDHFGSCERITVGREETVIHKGYGDEAEILQRVKDLKELIDHTQHEWDKDNLRIRIGKLTGGIAIVKVGGDSEAEMLEKKDRIEDALCAAKVSITDGIVPGGGWALYKIAERIEVTSDAEEMVKHALQAPIKQIITNVGENAEVILSHMPKDKGYNARTKEYEQLMINGIVDPYKVTKSAFENAISIVGLLLTTGGAIVYDQETKEGMPNPFAGLV